YEGCHAVFERLLVHRFVVWPPHKTAVVNEYHSAGASFALKALDMGLLWVRRIIGEIMKNVRKEVEPLWIHQARWAVAHERKSIRSVEVPTRRVLRGQRESRFGDRVSIHPPLQIR